MAGTRLLTRLMRIRDPELTAGDRQVLVWLVSYGDADGSGCYPTRSTLAADTGLTREGVRLALRKLERLGYIERGDQSRAAHYRADRRGVVYDLRDTPKLVVDKSSTGATELAPQSTGATQLPPTGATELPQPVVKNQRVAEVSTEPQDARAYAAELHAQVAEARNKRTQRSKVERAKATRRD